MLKTNKNLIALGLEIAIVLSFAVITFIAVKAEAYEYKESNYTYTFYPTLVQKKIPHVYSVYPNSIQKITKRTKVTVKGYSFVPDSVVRKNGVNIPTVFVDANNLIATIYPDEVTETEPKILLTVYNQETGEYSNSATFYITGNPSTPNYYPNGSGANYSMSANATNNNGQQTSRSNTNTSSRTSSTSGSQTQKKTITQVVSNTSNKIKQAAQEDRENENYKGLSANALYGASNGFMPTGITQWIIALILIILIISLFRYIRREKYMQAPMKHA